MDRRKSTGKGVPKPKPKPLPKHLPKPAKPYPILPPAPVAPSGQSLSQPGPFSGVMLPLPRELLVLSLQIAVVEVLGTHPPLPRAPSLS